MHLINETMCIIRRGYGVRIATLILGDSEGGKSTSLRNLDPQKTMLIQCMDKPLPFRSNDWKVRSKLNNAGSVIKEDNPLKIEYIMKNSSSYVFIIDDFQHVLMAEFMGRTQEKTFDKFTDIGKHTYLILKAAGKLEEHRRVYIMTHTQTDDSGKIIMKTIGKMVDQAIIPESFFTIVLRATVNNGNYLFSTQTNGMDCCKSPMGMFNKTLIDNDLKCVNDSICADYSINQTK